jgi:RNA polymerase sigma-70 factor, ECF subfamily
VIAADAAEEFLRVRPRLLGIAYRLLGSMWDAEDVVADAMVRWLRTDREQVREPAAFLTTMVSRLALDQLRSARAARDTYMGPWLPEPVLTESALPDPAEDVIKRETLSLATLRLMERLNPAERAVFVLREAFDIPYSQIAEILDVSVDSARHLLQRARARLADGRKRSEPDPAVHADLLRRFLHAVTTGELDDLENLLAADVVAYNDGGGKVRAALQPVAGRDNVVRFIHGLLGRFSLEPGVRTVEANGQPAAVFSLGGQPQLMALEVRDGKIAAIFGVLNPDKLTRLAPEPAGLE